MTQALVRWWSSLQPQTRWLCMLYGPWLLGLFICLGNHFSFAALHDQDVSRYNRTLIEALKNVWPLAVRGCMVASATSAFIPIVWSSLPSKSLSVEVVDSALQLPALAPALKIIFSGSLRDLIVPILATLNVLTYAVITVAPPATLLIRPMYEKLSNMTVPRPDFSQNSTFFAMIHSNWSYAGPDAYLTNDVQETLKYRRLPSWAPPFGCRSNCSYNVSYDTPVLQCRDYTPEKQPNSTAFAKTFYRGEFKISDEYPTLDIAAWPSYGNSPMHDGLDLTAPIGTRCTFYQGRQTVATSFGDNRQNTSIIGWAAQSRDPILGTSFGMLNTSSCPLSSVPAATELLDNSGPPCVDTRVQLNTWAFIDAFASPLVGEIREATSSHPNRFSVISRNNQLLILLGGIFAFNEYNAAFFYEPTLPDHNGTLQGLGNSLEASFAGSTLLLKSYMGYNGWSVVTDARVVPFASRYVYTPRFLWLAYAAALITVIVPCLIACFYIGKGFVLTDETTLSRVLAATRGDSFNMIKGLSHDSIDGTVIRYEQVQARSDWENGMGFNVVMKGEERGPKEFKISEDEVHLLSKA